METYQNQSLEAILRIPMVFWTFFRLKPFAGKGLGRK
jgi:hypothetical protein